MSPCLSIMGRGDTVLRPQDGKGAQLTGLLLQLILAPQVPEEMACFLNICVIKMISADVRIILSHVSHPPPPTRTRLGSLRVVSKVPSPQP